MKRINASSGSFEVLRNNDYLYVDKTEYLYNLIQDEGSFYFLSRPRRFGKSLTISTLEAIFRGKRELFNGLYIDSTDYDWKEYPVIHIDFSSIVFTDIDDLKRQIRNSLLSIAEGYGITLPSDYSYNEVLKYLIIELAKKEKVVILIDEYDNPLSSNINNKDIEDIRDVLRGFYSVIKASSAYIRLCFITGVTKFSKMSIFSAMNNLADISLRDEWATMLGYTQDELESNFNEYIDKGTQATGKTREEYLANIKRWYNGYRFSPKSDTVYNPVSIGFFFNEGGETFDSYWISTGGSLLLIEIAKKVKFDISTDTDITVSKDTLQAVDIIQMAMTEISKENFLSLLYQSGYLTIRKMESFGDTMLYKLGYPNNEVERGLNKVLLPLYLGTSASPNSTAKILPLIYEGKIDKAMDSLKTIFASIPYNELVFKAENAIHASFISMMRLMGADIIGEISTSIGRIDCVLTCPNDIYIIEFKYNQTAEKAIKQIRNNKYYEPYLDSGKRINLLGINFSTDKKNIIDWKCEKL